MPGRADAALASSVGRLGAWSVSWTHLRPPVRNPRFWATQGLVVVIAAVHDSLEGFGYLPSLGSAYFLPISMFFIPVVYSALYFGLSGAVATALWCTTISMPNWLLYHHGSEQVGVIVQMSIVDAIAVFVGSRVDQQMKARAEAEAATQALRASEGKYRGLFENSGEGVLVVDPAHRILEGNAAAATLFGMTTEKLRGRNLQAMRSAGGTGNRTRSLSSTDSFLIAGTDGADRWLEPVSTPLAEPHGGIQIVLRDVTEQKRRQMGLETYAAEVVRGQEEERKRIAQELHDDTVQSLVLLWRELDRLAASGADGTDSLVSSLQQARDSAGSIAESVRGYARGLRPPVLDDLGLTPAIRRLVEEFATRSSTPATLTVHGTDRRLSPDAELALFRIAQEALHNAERHAEASSVCVSLNYRPRHTEVAISDDGKGFEARPRHDALTDQSKLGLLGMRERARMAGGTLAIRSRPGLGTKVVARIPFTPAPEFRFPVNQ